jgi:hypothetical protein
VRRPQEDARFAVYFSRPWADALATSYRNFLASVFDALPLPALGRAAAERAHAAALASQADALRAHCASLQAQLDAALGRASGGNDGDDDSGAGGGGDAPARLRAAREAEGALIGGLLRGSGGSGGSSGVLSPPLAAAAAPTPAASRPPLQPLQPLQPLRTRAPPPPPPSAADEPSRQDANRRRPATASERSPSLRVATCDAFSGHGAPITCARFAPDGAAVASASADGTVRIWEPRAQASASAQHGSSWAQHGASSASSSSANARSATLYCGGAVAALEWEPRAAKLLLLATSAGGLRAWNAETKRIVCDAPAATSASSTTSAAGAAALSSARVRALRASPCDASFAVATGAGIAIWSLRSFRPTHTLPASPGLHAAPGALSYNHNGRLLAAGCADGTVRLFDVNAKTQIMAWRPHDAAGAAAAADAAADASAARGWGCAAATSVQFGHDQTSVFSLGADGALFVLVVCVCVLLACDKRALIETLPRLPFCSFALLPPPQACLWSGACTRSAQRCASSTRAPSARRRRHHPTPHTLPPPPTCRRRRRRSATSWRCSHPAAGRCSAAAAAAHAPSTCTHPHLDPHHLPLCPS